MYVQHSFRVLAKKRQISTFMGLPKGKHRVGVETFYHIFLKLPPSPTHFKQLTFCTNFFFLCLIFLGYSIPSLGYKDKRKYALESIFWPPTTTQKNQTKKITGKNFTEVSNRPIQAQTKDVYLRFGREVMISDFGEGEKK